MDIDGLPDPDDGEFDALSVQDPWLPDGAAAGDLFGDELAGVDADDWAVDADLIWGAVEEAPDVPETDLDLPLT